MSFTPGVFHGIPEDEYHAAQDSLSSTGAKTILHSPKAFKWRIDHPEEPSLDATRPNPLMRGTLTHALVLGQDHSFIRKDWNATTKEGKQARQDALDLGLIPMYPQDWDQAHEMAGAVLGHRHAAELLAAAGSPEVSIYARDTVTGINLRGRVDWLLDDETAVDLKTTRDADPAGGFPRTMANLGYHIQAAHYDRIMRVLGLRPPRFWFVAVEPQPPYNVSVVDLDQPSMDAGYRACDAAYEVYRDCMATGLWPTWRETGDDPVTVSLPKWSRDEVFL